MRGFVLAGIVFAAAAAYACDSFEESDVQPSADAGDDRAPVDPSDASDAGADQGATCEGEPEWVTTASAETTRTCGGGSVDLLTDANHCGRCNHSCGAEPCVAGTCAERKEDGDAAILAAVHAGAVYYVRRPGGSFSATPHELRRLVPGSAPVLLASLAADAGDAGGETKMLSASPSGDVVYVRTGKTIRRASATTPSNAVPELVANVPEEIVSSIVADADRVYMPVPGGNRIDQVFLDGGIAPFIPKANHPGETRLVDGRFFWSSQAFIFLAGNASSIHSKDKTLYESAEKVGGLAIDGNDGYVLRAGKSGAIVRIDLTTGATQPFYEGELDNSIFAIAVAVDATHVYWLKETASSGSTTEVWKRARCGGAAVRIAKHPFTYRIALLGDRLYLGAEDGLFSIAK